jgi:hypothetical protein
MLRRRFLQRGRREGREGEWGLLRGRVPWGFGKRRKRGRFLALRFPEKKKERAVGGRRGY